MAPPGRRGEWQLLALRVRSIVFTAQFFHSRTDRREIVGGAGSIHVSSFIGLVSVSWPVNYLQPPAPAIVITLNRPDTPSSNSLMLADRSAQALEIVLRGFSQPRSLEGLRSGDRGHDRENIDETCPLASGAGQQQAVRPAGRVPHHRRSVIEGRRFGAACARSKGGGSRRTTTRHQAAARQPSRSLIGVATSWGCTNMARRWFVDRVTTPPPIAVLGSVTWARGCRFCCGASAMGCARR
jgi:hypothetical protein